MTKCTQGADGHHHLPPLPDHHDDDHDDDDDDEMPRQMQIADSRCGGYCSSNCHHCGGYYATSTVVVTLCALPLWVVATLVLALPAAGAKVLFPRCSHFRLTQ